MDYPLDKYLRNRALMNVLASFILGVVVTIFAPPVGYALASGATIGVIFIYRAIKRGKAKGNGSEKTG